MSQIKVDSIVPSGGLPSGSSGGIVQIVNGTTSTSVTSSTNVYVASGLTATITPTSTSNKILVLGNLGGCDKRTGNTYMSVSLRRDSSEIYVPEVQALWSDSTATTSQTVSFQYLDSPATTSAVTYDVYFKSVGNTAQVSVQWASAGSSITLIEVSG
tara:strand:+ start:859 stop:1329 length:471 start_codon:yes stop_codon:yes gene_type:complete